MTDGRAPAQPDRPLLAVVGGQPTAAEVAALVAVLAARASAPAAQSGACGAGWTDRGELLRESPTPGHGAWRASGRRPGRRTAADW